MLQSVFLRVFIKFGLFVLQISGLWPFTYNSHTKKFKFLWYFTILPIIIIVYPLVVLLFWSKYLSSEIYGKNVVVQVLSIGFIVFNSLNFIFMFINHYLQFNEIKVLIVKTHKVLNELNSELDKSKFEYGKLLLKYALKTVILQAILIYGVLANMARFTKFEDNYIMYILSMLPNVIMKLHPDVFYGGLIVMEFYLKQINGKVSSVLTKAENLSENNDLNEQKRYQKMINYCELSDQLDRLCVLQSSVIEISKSFTQICSFQTTSWIALGLSVVLLNLFQVYMTISASIRNDQFAFSLFVSDFLAVCLVIVETYATTSMSDSVMAEVGIFILQLENDISWCPDDTIRAMNFFHSPVYLKTFFLF